MSSRALRKLQHEQERLLQLEKLNESTRSTDHLQDHSDSDAATSPQKTKKNIFDTLNATEEEEEEEAQNISPMAAEGATALSGSDQETPQLKSSAESATRGKSKKKKKKTKRSRDLVESHRNNPPAASDRNVGDLDEIDLALRTLSSNGREGSAIAAKSVIDEQNQQLSRLLSVETKHLNALNEMKRLFGDVVLERDGDDAGPAVPARRRGRGPQQVDLGGALAGRNSPVSRGQGFAGLALRRNVFMQGKEEWPKATAGGLGMEVVSKERDGTTQYRFVHSTAYQDVQRQFESCVESMDPQRMIQLLQFNPYHISTLLQVSEIAKQQGDHSVSGDLLERALFSFGRSVHSSFSTALSEGKVRLDFQRPENREFWLASWRYMTNLGQRGTWRTAYEWAKLLLSLDPDGDPYCVRLIMDQLALRGGQAEHFVTIDSHPIEERWPYSLNLAISRPLAEYRLKHPEECRELLGHVIADHPWVFARLFHQLNIEHIPKSIWGREPRTEREKFDCELYVHRAKDLWNTPEAISLLVEVAEVVTPKPPAEDNTPIDLNEARHILLTGESVLLGLIPREYTSMPTSSSDPLPPPHELLSYSLEPSGTTSTFSRDASQPVQEQTGNASGLLGLYRRLIPWLGLTGSTVADANSQLEDLPQAAMERFGRLVDETGISPDAIREHVEVLENQVQQHRAGTLSNASLNDSRGDLSDNSPRQIAAVNPLDVTRMPLDAQENQPHPIEVPQEQEPSEEERNKRWLAGQGLVQFKAFVAVHGVDEDAWTHAVDDGIVREYARKIATLKVRRTKDFILDYVLPQGTSQEAKKLILRYVEQESHGSEG